MGLGRGLGCGSLGGGRLAARPPPGVVRSVFVWSYFCTPLCLPSPVSSCTVSRLYLVRMLRAHVYLGAVYKRL